VKRRHHRFHISGLGLRNPQQGDPRAYAGAIAGIIGANAHWAHVWIAKVIDLGLTQWLIVSSV
jgi:hypothetical protein